MPFADEFISGFQSGQQMRRQRTEQERAERQLAYDEVNHKLEVDKTKHHLRALKLVEQEKARAAALDNLKQMEGTDAEDLLPEQVEGGQAGLPHLPDIGGQQLPGFDIGGRDLPNGMRPENVRMNPMQIPGINVDEIQIPGITQRPRTMQEVLAEAVKKQRTMDENKIQEVPAGASQMRGGDVLGTAPEKIDRRTVKVTNRDPDGTTYDTWVTPEEAKQIQAVKSPLPSRSSRNLTDGRTISDVVDGIVAGLDTASLDGLKGDDARDVRAALSKRGFNRYAALREQRAVMAAISTLNAPQIAEVSISSQATSMAMQDLRKWLSPPEEGSEPGSPGWKKEWGKANWPNFMAAKGGIYGDEAKNAVAEIENITQAVRQGITEINSSGSQANNKTLAAAAEVLQPSYLADDLLKRVDRLQTLIGYRTAAMSSYQPVTPGQAGAGAGAGAPTDAQIKEKAIAGGFPDVTAEDIAKIRANKELMAELFK